MANILEYQQKELDALGENKVEASLNLHRKQLNETSTQALDIIQSSLPDAPLKEVISAYDVTRKHLNIIDGRSDNQTINVFIPPPELQQHYSLADEIKAQIIEDTKCQIIEQPTPPKKSPSTKPKKKLPETTTASV